MRQRILACAVCLAATLARAGSAAVVDATWLLNGNGNWNTAANWDIGVVPNNNATDQYNVRIDNDTPNVIVSLNISPTINNLTIDTADTLTINNNLLLATVGTTITNNGTLNLQSTGNFTDLRMADGTILSGAGNVVLGNNANNRFYGVSGTAVVTVAAGQTISGAGQIGANQLVLVNQGLINANVASANFLVMNPSGAGVTNAASGILQASGGGTLYLTDGTFTNNGLIQALAGSQVALANGSVVVGGTLSATDTGRIVVRNNESGGLAGTITNNGIVNLQAAGNLADLLIANGTTLNGSGSLVLGGSANNRVYRAAAATDELINGATHTISGGGQLGVDLLKLTNQGLIDANMAGSKLIVDPSASGVANTGTMQASGGGILRLQGSGGVFTNTGGVIQALDGSQVELGGGGTVVGGTLTTSGSGKIVVPNNDNGGLAGTITNNGIVNLQAAGNLADLLIANGTTLNGSGSLVLGGSANNRVYRAAAATDELINGATHTISGGGQLGVDLLKLTNQGLIDANMAGSKLIVDPSASGVANTGTMQASGGGILRLQGSGGVFTNTGGVIQALDGSQVELGGGGTVVGGTLTTSGSGKIVVPNNDNGGLAGTITNNGIVNLQAAGNLADLLIANGTTLNGSGSLVLGGSANNRVYRAAAATDELINGATHTISGGGQLGVDLLKLTNQGLIDANMAGSKLIVDPSASGVANTGTMQASGGGILRLQGSGGVFTNTGGVIQALDGSQVELGGGGTVVGGTLTTSGSGKIVVPNNDNGGLAGTITNNGIVNLQAAGNLADLLIANGTTLNGSGSLVLGGSANNRVYRAAAATDELINGATHTISGGGQLGVDLLKLTNQGLIDANVAQVLTIDPSAAGVTNTGTLQASGGGTLNLTGGTFTNNTSGVIQASGQGKLQLLNGTFNNNGTVRTIDTSEATLAAGSTLSNNGTLSVGAGSMFTLSGTYTDTATAQTVVNGKLIFAGPNVTLNGSFADSATGHTVVNNTLARASGPITINGKLGGTGTVNDQVTLTSSAVIAPGASAGTLRTGDFTMTAGATYEWEYSSAATKDSVVINSGNLSLGANLTLEVGYAGPVLLPNTADHTLFQVTSGAITGSPNWTIQLPFGWTSQGVVVEGNLVKLKNLSVVSSNIGDYNYNGFVDAADYVVWRKLPPGSSTNLVADGNRNGQIDSGDFDVWRAHFGQTAGSGSGASANAAVPEPATSVMLIVTAAGVLTRRRQR